VSRSIALNDLSSFGPAQDCGVSLRYAQRYVRRFTHAHGENFSVLSPLLPRSRRDAFAAVYAFCRWADDLADDPGTTQRRFDLLAWWQAELDRCFQGRPRHPVLVALAPVIEAFALPRTPFDDLLAAFRQDQRVHRYDTWGDLVGYCQLSANPVGRLVLCLADCRSPEQWQQSDATCTALQLTNFWQDVRRDLLQRDRIYIPTQMADRHGLDLTALEELGRLTPGRANRPSRITADESDVRAYQAILRELVDHTWPLFKHGRLLWPSLPREMLRPIQLFTLGGEAMLRRIEHDGYRTLWRRPRLSRADKLLLIGRLLMRRL
jgi:squalene synthase HpnC